ncbi:MAG: DNA mismatch repair protein MutS [Dysgonamonadaceae bacterium]|jgi:hypothetical protein|nr:DNA mismatch repair protein MutS [Dysgonamonadaceae bacterium]
MTISQLQTFYRKKIDEDLGALNVIKRNIRFVGSLRLVTVVLAALTIYFYKDAGSIFIVTGISVALVIMLVLIKKHNGLFRKKDYLTVSMRVSWEELEAIDYRFSSFDGAPEKIDATHAFSHDVDLFGNRSLFQSINRTVTPNGKEILARWFESPLTDRQSIAGRQDAIRELAQQQSLRSDFRIKGLLHPGTEQDIEKLQQFTLEPNYLLRHKRLWQTLSRLVLVFWIVFICGLVFDLIPASFTVVAIIGCCGLGECKIKKINIIHKSLEEKVKMLAAYADLIRIIENNTVSSVTLNSLQQTLFNYEHNSHASHRKKVSETIRELSGLLDNLDQRSSGLGRFILNTLLLWDIRYALKIEQWKTTHGKHLPEWLETLGTYDAFCSLATFAYNHPDYVFPEITGEYFTLEATAMGHPLMHRDVCVKNDISITQAPFFMIVTGANMAGKSTYLRTVGVNYLLASIGAPVCASEFVFYPVKLVTSLRTSDSLSDNESYFFAELKRLKMIIDQLKTGEKLFIILDEILKGTNSVDKQKGSLALMRQLVNMVSCGIIATHDLALGKLEEDFPDYIKNYRFEASIEDNELNFSYQMQTGIAKNMNACFLMNKMGIIV